MIDELRPNNWEDEDEDGSGSEGEESQDSLIMGDDNLSPVNSTTSSQADEEEELEEAGFRPLLSLKGSITLLGADEVNGVHGHDHGNHDGHCGSGVSSSATSSTDSSPCSSANSSGEWAVGLAGPTALTGGLRRKHHHRLRKSVDFNGTDQIVLIPARVDYDEQTKNEIWWSMSDYDYFKEATRAHFHKKGGLFRLDSGVHELMEDH